MAELKLHELKALDALARAGGIGRAAEALFVSPPAVHKRLQMLERKLGMSLYEVVGQELTLTAAAEVVLPHVREMLLRYEAIESALDDWRGVEGGLVRIATGTTFSSHLLPMLIEAYRERGPRVDLLVETGNTTWVLNAAAKGETDIGITLAAGAIENREIYRVEAEWSFECVLVSGRKPEIESPSLHDLSEQPVILYKHGSRLGEIVEQYFARHAFRPRVAMRFDSPESIKGMVRAGLGISMLPRWMLETELRRGTLWQIRQREEPIVLRLVLVTREGRYRSRAVDAFVELAKGWRWPGELSETMST